MKILLFVLLIGVSFYGCEKNYVDVSPSLIGKWSWVSTCGGIAPHCSYADSTTQKIKLIITADSTYKIYQNDTLIVTDKFHAYELSGFWPDNKIPTYGIKFNGGGQSVFSFTYDELYIWDGSLDGYSMQYKRMK